MLKHFALAPILLALIGAGCVEHYDFKYLTDGAIADNADAKAADGLADLSTLELPDNQDTLPDSSGEILSDLVTDLADAPAPDQQDAIEPDQQDSVATDLLDLVDEEAPCIPDCTDLECGDDGCGGSCGNCDDDNDCTEDFCSEDICEHTNLSDNDCYDPDPCSSSEGYCEEGVCNAAQLPLGAIGDFEVCWCAEDADCLPFDTDPCDNSVMLCDPELEDEAHPHCYYKEIEVPTCDDGVSCTTDSCDSNTGCVHLPSDAPCNGDNPCIKGTCSPLEGCQYEPLSVGGCDDNDLCTVQDTCVNGSCAAGDALDCDDLVPCTVDTCAPESGCLHNPLDSDCNDNNFCTDDSCDPEKGCQHDNNNLACDDDLACTELDTCNGSICAGTPVLCDDDNECTLDSCNPDDGKCVATPVADNLAQECDASSNQCTEAIGQCLDGSCIGSAIDCDDTNVCTDDSCIPESGCLYVNNDLGCSDDNTCTLNDFCAAGECNSGLEINVACLDYDHDGLANGVDSCPLAFDGKELNLDLDGAADACEPVTDAPPITRALNLLAAGLSSTTRRTHEVVEVPLVNGIADLGANGYLPLDGDASMPFEKGGAGGELIGTTPTEGAFGDPGGGLYFGGSDAIRFAGIELPDITTLCLWMKPDEVHDFAFGSLFPQGAGGKFDFQGQQGKVTVLLRSSPADSFLMTTEASLNDQLFDGEWHQLCFQWNVLEAAGGLFLDGQLWPTTITTQGSPKMSTAPLADWYTGAFYDGQLGIPVAHYKGRLDEMLVSNRIFSSQEIETYYRSNAPFATPVVPGAQKDFDDVRIIDPDGYDGTPVYRRSRIVGVRPHSDSPCPAGTSPATWPHREDLCGVVAYWPLGSNLESVVGNYNLSSLGNGESVQLGRFGDAGGASVFYGGGDLKSSTISAAKELKDDDLAIELWYFTKEGDLPGGYLLGMPVSPTEQVTELSIAEDGALQWTLATTSGTATLQATGGTSRWVHVALNYDGTDATLYVDGLARDRTSLTGNLKSTTLPLYVGAAGEPDELKSKSMMDEILIHDTAKTADYFFNRARPELPSIRFLVSTTLGNAGTDEAPSYPSRSYLMGWGNGAATMVSPYVSSTDSETACYGFLNQCLGYVGWWTFDDFDGQQTSDLSNHHLHAHIKGAAQRIDGAHGLAVQMDGASIFEVPFVPLMQTPVFTLETMAMGGSGTLLSRGKLGDDDVLNYRLSIESGGAIYTDFELDDGASAQAKSASVYEDGLFQAIGTTYGGAQLLAFLSTKTVAAAEIAAVPGQTLQDLWFGGVKSPSNEATAFFSGAFDDVRVMNRALERDEMLHYPVLLATPGSFLNGSGKPLDSDSDGILDDGDGSLIIGDNPCVGGEIANCDDNAVDAPNGDQADEDGDGIGSVVDNCPNDANEDQADHDNNGMGDVCDPTFNTDWDHDGIVGEADPCPYAFDGVHADYNGDGDPDACKPYVEGFNNGQSIWLDDGGNAPGRRTTNEVVDLPLKSGTIDASTLLYLPFENQSVLDESPTAVAGITNTGQAPGFQGGPQGLESAVSLDGGCITFADPFTYPVDSFTVMTWIQTDKSVSILDNGKVDEAVPLHPAHGLVLYYVDSGKLGLTLGDGTVMAPVEASFEPWQAWDWHHVAATFHLGKVRIYVDGDLQQSANFSGDLPAINDAAVTPHIGCTNEDVPSGDLRLDDFLLFGRSLTPREIKDYVASHRPYGKTLLEGTQDDFDDVRIMEFPHPEEVGKQYVTRTQVIGVRPHSDSNCPVGAPEETFASRDDLCGVAGFWRLDSAQGDEVTQGSDSPLKLLPEAQNPWFAFGRFGSPNGGIRFGNRSQVLTVASPPELSPGTSSFSIEAWLRVPDTSVGSVLYPVDKVDNNTNGYQMTYSVNGGFFGCQWFGNSGEMIVLSSSKPLNDRQWHHVGCVLDRPPGGSITALVYVDGIQVKKEVKPENHLSSLDSDTPFRIGWANQPGNLSQELDEVLYHAVAKSPDYFFYRARPSVPRLRFLANSTTVSLGDEANPDYPLRGYELKWGKGNARAAQAITAKPDSEQVCFGVINQCLGYVGWWQLEELDSSQVLDSGPNHLRSVSVGSMYWRYDNGQVGLANNGSPGYVSISTAPVLAQSEGTWEATFRPGLNINGNVPAPLVLFSRVADQGKDDYAASIVTDGKLYYNREPEGGNSMALYSAKSDWFHDQIYHTAFHAGNGSNTFSVNYLTEEAQSSEPGGFGGDGVSLYLGSRNGTMGYFNGTFYEFRYMSRVLEPDEYLRQIPLQAYLPN